MINLFSSSFLNKIAQLIHLTIDLSRLHKNLNYGKFEKKIWVNLHHYNNRFKIFQPSYCDLWMQYVMKRISELGDYLSERSKLLLK